MGPFLNLKVMLLELNKKEANRCTPSPPLLLVGYAHSLEQVLYQL